MRNLINQSKIQLSLFLLLIYALNLIVNFSYQMIFSVFLTVSAAVISDFIFLKIRKVKIFFPSAAIATGLIIALLTDPNLPYYFPITAGIFAMLSKNFLRLGRHIFNPASFGLIFILILFGVQVSWWGVAWQIPDSQNLQSLIPFAILLSPAFVSAYKMKRFRIILSFLLVNGAWQMAFNQHFFIQSFLDPTIIFFSLVMLPEPMTTPNKPLRQILFGSLVGLFMILSSEFVMPAFNVSFDPLIPSLLLGNLLFFKYR